MAIADIGEDWSEWATVRKINVSPASFYEEAEASGLTPSAYLRRLLVRGAYRTRREMESDDDGANAPRIEELDVDSNA